MSSIVRQKVGDKIYLYESISYRNKNGKPRNKRVPIRKIDTSTGNPIYKPEYLARMAEAGTPVKITETWLRFSEEDIRGSSIKDYGAFYPFKTLLNKLDYYHPLSVQSLSIGRKSLCWPATSFHLVTHFCIVEIGFVARPAFPSGPCS